MSAPSVFEDLFGKLSRDAWRADHPFNEDIAETQRLMFETDSREAVRGLLLDWIGRYQPCLFGRMAARIGALETCIVFEREILENGEEWLAAEIERARYQWVASTFSGGSSGFVVAVISERIAYSTPDAVLSELARLVCSLYLARADIALDQIFHDEAYLGVPGAPEMTWKWLAGVNYFCANGDGRWWRDHRIPGGFAFSTNSVGHLVKSEVLRKAQEDFWERLGIDIEPGDKAPMDSLPKALRLAMQTIYLASDGVSGKATTLIDRSADTPTPPIDLKSYLANKDHRYYRGFYHTDHTLPSPYFEAAADRSSEIEGFDLDFSYLFDKSIDNPDHVTMGAGRRIRHEHESDEAKISRVEGELIQIASSLRLTEALKRVGR